MTAMLDNHAATWQQNATSALVRDKSEKQIESAERKPDLRLLSGGQERTPFLKSADSTDRSRDAEKESAASSAPVSPRDQVVPLNGKNAHTVLDPASSQQLDPVAERILRVHFADHIINALREIQPHSQTPSAAVYADTLLRTMRAMNDLSPGDPCLFVVMALHDALAHENRWADYKAEQFEGARRILSGLVNDKRLNDDKIDKAIIALEDLGFDTTPFAIDADLTPDDLDDER